MNLHSSLLSNDCAVVTGGARGNGAAIALGLAQHGAAVAIADVDGDEACQVAQSINAAGGRAAGFSLDVTSGADCLAFANVVRDTLGPVSILINNAGIVRKTDPHASDFSPLLKQHLDVNVMGCAWMVQALLPQLTQRRGRIVNIASIMSFVSYAGSTAYAASKGAVKQLTLGLAADLAKDGIRVNGIAPGFFETRMTAGTRSDPQLLAQRLQHIPLGRMGLPTELVGPVVFLVSELSSYVTGTIVSVDGGYLAV